VKTESERKRERERKKITKEKEKIINEKTNTFLFFFGEKPFCQQLCFAFSQEWKRQRKDYSNVSQNTSGIFDFRSSKFPYVAFTHAISQSKVAKQCFAPTTG